MKSKVSIALPVYNGENFIAQAIDNDIMNLYERILTWN
jgi:glycosyltransferase involved in cell wall biosynthesis